MKKRGMNKKAIESETLYWWLVAFFLLVICVLGIWIIFNKDNRTLQYILDVIRFKR